MVVAVKREQNSRAQNNFKDQRLFAEDVCLTPFKKKKQQHFEYLYTIRTRRLDKDQSAAHQQPQQQEMSRERDEQLANKNPIIFCCGSQGCSLSIRDKAVLFFEKPAAPTKNTFACPAFTFFFSKWKQWIF